MKLLRSEETFEYKEIEVERNYILWKSKTIYRKYNESIFKYEPPNNFYILGTWEGIDIRQFFKIKL